MDKKFISDFLKGSAASSIGSLVSMVFHFVSIMLLTRHLSKDELGLYVLIIVTAFLFNLFAGFGLEITLTKYIASEEKEKRGEILSTILLARTFPLIVSLFLFILLGDVVAGYIEPRIAEYLTLIPLLILIANYRDLFNNLMQGLKIFRNYAVVQISSAIIRVGLIITAIAFQQLSIDFLILIEISSTGAALLMQLIVIPFRSFFSFRPNLKLLKPIIQFTLPLYLNNLLTFVYDRINIFIISIYLTAEHVASYDVAEKIPDALKKIFYSFIIVYFPNIANLFAEKKTADAEKLLNRSMTTVSVVISFLVFVSFLFNTEIVELLFSKTYLPAAFAFSLLMLNFYLRALSNILGYSLVSAGYSSTSIKTNLVSSAVSITSSLLMVPKFGFIGAVYGLLAMNTVSQIIYSLYLKKYLFKPNYREYLKPLVLILPVLFIHYTLEIESLLLKLILIFTYLMIGWFFIKEFRYLFEFALNIFRKKVLKKA
jgi:O-antigen/teichoic acid export membrane protein